VDVFDGGEDVYGLAQDGRQVGRPLPDRGHRWDGRSFLAAAPQPDQDSRTVDAQIVHLRWHQRLGPVQIAGQLGTSA